MSSNKFYVYEHWRTDKNEPFYVGKGQKRRAFHMHATTRNEYHRFIQAKLKRIGAAVNVKIVARDLSETDAFAEENRRIIFWRSQGAVLANFTDGGEGFSGGKQSEEWRKALGERAKGWWSDPNYRKNIVSKLTGKKRTEEQKKNYSGPKSLEHIEAMRRSAKTRKRPIVRTDQHRKNASSSLKIAIKKMWDERKKDPQFITLAEEKKRKIVFEKNKAKDAKIFLEAKDRFTNFIYALIENTSKRCADCKMTKAPSEFTTGNSVTGRRHAYCKTCCARRQNEIRQRNRAGVK